MRGIHLAMKRSGSPRSSVVWYKKAAAESKITYATVAAAPSLAWVCTPYMVTLHSLIVGRSLDGFLGVDVKARKKATLSTSKAIERPSMTTSGSVPRALVSILDEPEGTKNNAIRIHGGHVYFIGSLVSEPCFAGYCSFVSVREIMDIVKGEWGTCETTNVDVTELQANAQARMAQGERSREVLRDLIIRASVGDRSGHPRARMMRVGS